MKIYIDETSIFKIVPSSGVNISGVGALVIPDCYQERIEKRYLRLRENFKKQNGEVKGKLLNETEVKKVVELLLRNDAIFEVSIIDLGLEKEGAIERHRKNQILGLGENLTADHHENIHAAIAELQQRLERMPLQLYIQSVLGTEVISRVFRHAPLYYVQRQPKELGNFEWIIDAKSPNGETDWESWWKKVILPFLQSKSLREPGIRLIGADYSYFKAKEIPRPDWFPKKEVSEKNEKVTLINDIFSNIKFISEINYGLEMVDILTNAIRRAIVGNLSQVGWEDISKLIIFNKGDHRVQLVSFDKDTEKIRVPYYAIIKKWDENGRSMVV